MDSLYGGKPGLSFTLKGSFESIEDMQKAFDNGDSYTEIWYGEYCIIDTPNKNNPDNGKIFRRGINYYNGDKQVSLTECIGQIVGPSSGTPSFCLNTLFKTDEDGKNGKWVLPKEAEIAEEQVDVQIGDSVVRGFVRTSTSSEEAAISFTKGVEALNDNKAKYTWQNIRVDASDKNESNSWFGVQLEIPTQTNIFKAEAGSPYKTTELLQTDENSHMFYQKHKITVPRGIQGISVTDLRIENLSSFETTETYYSAKDVFKQIQEDGTFDTSVTLPIKTLPTEKTSYLVGTITSYQNGKAKVDNEGKETGDYISDPIKYHVIFASYDLIDTVKVDADSGQLKITYTGEKESSETFLDYIKTATLTSGDGTEGGYLSFKDSSGNENSHSQINWIKNININGDGTVTLTVAGTFENIPDNLIETEQDGIYTLKNKLVWPKKIELNQATGEYTITSNQDKPIAEGQFAFPKKIGIKKDEILQDDVFYVTYSDGMESSLGYTNNIKSVFAKNGDLFYTLHDGINDDDEEGLGLYSLTDFQPLNVVKDIEIVEHLVQNSENEENNEFENNNYYNLEKTFIENGETLKEIMVEDISMLSSGADAIVFNQGEQFEEITVEEETEEGEIVTNTINGLPLLQGDRKLHIKYSLPKDQEIITEPINSIEDITVYRNKIYVLYGDINARNQGYETNSSDTLKPGWQPNLDGTFYNKELAINTEKTYLWKSIGDISPNGYQFADQINISRITSTIKSEGIEGAGTLYTDSINDILIYLEEEYFKSLNEKYEADILDKVKNGFLVAVNFSGDVLTTEDDYSKLFFRKITYYTDSEEDTGLKELGIWSYIGTLFSASGAGGETNKDEIDLTYSTPTLQNISTEFLFLAKTAAIEKGSVIKDPWVIKGE